MEKNKRLQYLDICKGILIILVVLGHCLPEQSILHKYIYSFHIPAFFVVSGIGLSYVKFSNRPLLPVKGKKSVLFTNIKKLIIPYFIYAGLLLLFRWAYAGFSRDVLTWELKDLFLFTGVGATWFLPCLCLAQLLCWGLINFDDKFMFGKKIFLSVSAILLFVVAVIVPSNNFITLVLFRAFIATSFVLIGYFGIKIIEQVLKLRTVLLVIVLLSFSLLSIAVFIFTGHQSVALNALSFNNPVFYIINALFGTGFVVVLSILLEKTKVINVIFSFLGKGSLIIMGTHQIVMLLFSISIKDNIIINGLNCLIVLMVESLLVFAVEFIKRKVLKNEK